jgi:hypothetical protein
MDAAAAHRWIEVSFVTFLIWGSIFCLLISPYCCCTNLCSSGGANYGLFSCIWSVSKVL